ncbi:MAG: carbon storage regulator [Oscillospiraceae bacterium]
MLVISRKLSQSVLIGDDIEIIVTEITPDRIRLGISAPKDVLILRKELAETAKVNEESNNSNADLMANKLNKFIK